MGQKAFPRVRDFMDRTVPTVHPDAPIVEAVALLLEAHVTGAPVLDDAGRLVGIVTEYDMLRLLAAGPHDARASGKVRDYMTTEVVTVTPDMDIYFAAGLFLRNPFRRLPVLEGGRLVGAITRYDILRAIRANLAPADAEPTEDAGER